MVGNAPQQTEERRQLRTSTFKWIFVSEMKVSPTAQRKFTQSHADQYAANFDLDAMGIPVVSRRDGAYWIVDGQHRIAALKQIGLGNEKIQCEVYEGLSEADEAELFLTRDDRWAVSTLDKFMIGIVAEREIETAINKIVQGCGLRIGVGGNGSPKSIKAVSALRAVYDLGGKDTLKRTLMLLRDGFPDDGTAFKATILRGMGLVVVRYGTALKDEALLAKLLALRGGPEGVARKADRLHLRTDRGMADCMAGAIVEVYNGGGPGGGKLQSWWK